jgi:Pyridoxamine 5'-phosphate oxidase
VAKGNRDFLADPLAQQLLSSTIPARVAYTWTDGSPRVVSLWFHWDGRHIVCATFGPAPKLKALHTGSPAALTIDTDSAPNRVLSVRGTAEVTPMTGVVREYTLAAHRYLGADNARAYISSLPPDIPMARIAVQPEAVVLLDFETRVPSALVALGLAHS